MIEDMPRTFELTPDLIKLLRNSNVSKRLSNCEYGAAEIDPKRPYGNSMGIELDIAEILGWEVEDELTQEQEDRAAELHAQTPLALKIVLSQGSFEPGTFQQTPAYRWERVS